MNSIFHRRLVHSGALLIVVATSSFAGQSHAQQLAGVPGQNSGRQDAAVVVEGVARQVFRNLQASDVPYVVQVEVRRSEVKRSLPADSKLAFHNDEFAVKISEVAPDSPAARAGLQPGMLILKVNGKPVLHPAELTEAVRQAGRSAKLEVVDPRTGRTSVVNVAL